MVSEDSGWETGIAEEGLSAYLMTSEIAMSNPENVLPALKMKVKEFQAKLTSHILILHRVFLHKVSQHSSISFTKAFISMGAIM